MPSPIPQDPRQREIARRLEFLGGAPSTYFRDACELMSRPAPDEAERNPQRGPKEPAEGLAAQADGARVAEADRRRYGGGDTTGTLAERDPRLNTGRPPRLRTASVARLPARRGPGRGTSPAADRRASPGRSPSPSRRPFSARRECGSCCGPRRTPSTPSPTRHQ